MKKSAFYSFITITYASTLLLGGCRFGNHADQPQPLKSASTYKSIEFFFTSPKQFQIGVILNSLSGPDSVETVNNNAPLAAIPSSILNAFTDPVYFAVPNDPTQFPTFWDYGGTYKFLTEVDASGNVSHDFIPASSSVFWGNQDCLTNYEVTHKGTFDRSKPGTITYPDGTKAPVAGSLSFTYSYTKIFSSQNGTDNCTADLTRLATCYTASSGCSSDEITKSKEVFDLYVKQTGILKIEDAAKIKGLEYIVHYE